MVRPRANADNTITYVPAADYFGSDSFSYMVSDGRGGGQRANVNITIRAVNDGPVILIAPSDQVNQVGDGDAAYLASDPDTAEDALSFSAQNLPPGIAVDSQRGLISGTLAADAAGIYQVVTTKKSDGALSDSVQFVSGP
ncbi:MAG: cadherin-like domain-containing protein [Caldilineaceae bacterium]|nr:cadherin-like domain-containing protein [Caldilineaceae bacterium]